MSQPTHHHHATLLGKLLQDIEGAQLSAAEIRQVGSYVSELKARHDDNTRPTIRIVANADTDLATNTVPRVDLVTVYGAESYERAGLPKPKGIKDLPEDLHSLCSRTPVASILVWDEGLPLSQIVGASQAWPILLGTDVVAPIEKITQGWRIVPLSSCADPETDSLGVAAAIAKISATQSDELRVSACSPRILALAALLHFTASGEKLLLAQPTLTAWEDIIFNARNDNIYINNFSGHSLDKNGMGGVRLAPTIAPIKQDS